MAEQKNIQTEIVKKNGRSYEMLSYPDGLREERQLDENGVANGSYGIYRGDQCIEYGTMKDGKRDGESERYDKNDNVSSVTFYKDGKERKVMSTLANMVIKLNNFIKKSEAKDEEMLQDYRVKGYVWLQSLKDLFNKMTGFEKLRESFAPRKKETDAPKRTKKSNSALLAENSTKIKAPRTQKQTPAQQKASTKPTVHNSNTDIYQLARLSGKGDRAG